MYPANITRAEAAARSAMITTPSYEVVVDITGKDAPRSDWFFSSTKIHFASLGGDSHVNIICGKLLTAKLDGEDIPAADYHDEKIYFPTTAGEHELEITAWMVFSHTGEGLHRLNDPADGLPYLYTQFEPADARRMYACFEQPDLKAAFALTVIAPSKWTILSNSPAPEPILCPDDPQYARFEFAPTPPISTYLTALIAGPYHCVSDNYTTQDRVLPLGIYCRKSLVAHLDAERIFATTKAGLAVYEANFGLPYPFAKYDQVFVPEYNFGAMENAGCITFRDEYIFRSRVTKAAYESRDNTILHEMAHMWFGDLVTMKWWDDLWLNESFAEWASHWCQAQIRKTVIPKATSASDIPDDPWVTFANSRKSWAYKQDQLPTTHPIAADMVDLEAVELNFDGITYAKGASTLKQLVAFVGEADFLAGLRSYFKEHAWGNTCFSDLLTALSAASKRDLNDFATSWLQSTGVNTLHAEFDTDSQGCFTHFGIRQSADAAHPTLRRHRIAIGYYEEDGESIVRTQRIETDIAAEYTEIPEAIGLKRPQLLLLNDEDLSYAKIRLDDVSLATLTARLQKIADPLARALCWGAAWDMCRDAELPAADYVKLVAAAARGESDLTAVSAALSQAKTAIDYYSPRNQRMLLADDFAMTMLHYAAVMPPGSDHQLSFFRAYLANVALTGTTGHENAVALKEYLTGTRALTGLSIDVDLRWRIVTKLAQSGALDSVEIDQEQAGDNTAQGAELAAGARAALPALTAKRAAWELAATGDEVSNAAHWQICSNFWQFDQDSLAQFVTPYFELVTAISAGNNGWDQRSSTIRQHVLTLLFPTELMDATRLQAAQDWFDSQVLSEPVRRPIAEQLDASWRALRCQNKDGAAK